MWKILMFIQTLIKEVVEVWNKSGIPTRQSNHCVDTLVKIHKNWLLLKKQNKEAQKNRESLFTEELDKLFDIAHENVMNLIKRSFNKKKSHFHKKI